MYNREVTHFMNIYTKKIFKCFSWRLRNIIKFNCFVNIFFSFKEIE